MPPTIIIGELMQEENIQPRHRQAGTENQGLQPGYYRPKPKNKKKSRAKLFFYIFFTTVSGLILATVLLVAAYAAFSYYHFKNYLAHRAYDTDGDGVLDPLDPDVDNDGLLNMADPDADGDGINNTEDVLAAAEQLIGKPYDQLGGIDTRLWDFGAIVCMDLINLSYEKAGIYFDREIKELYKRKRLWFEDPSWNNPFDVNFSRRVRNFKVLCEYKNLFIDEKEGLQRGDIIMFGQWHIAIIEKVEGDSFTVIETSSKKFVTMRAEKMDIYMRNIKRNGPPEFARLSLAEKNEK